MTGEGAFKRVQDLFGLPDEQAEAFVHKLIAEVGDYTFSDSIFLFHCLKLQQEQIKELKRQVSEKGNSR